MPSCPRGDIVHPEEVGVYHCWSRCVRRAFLCGWDTYTDRDYEFRRDWICLFEETLAGLFAIEIGFRAELGNHIHLVIRNRPDVVETWSDEEVVHRWLQITHVVKSKDGQVPEISAGQIALEMADPERMAVLRLRLSDPSFFMGALCEHVAKRSNREEETSGRFWEDRYRCRNLASEAAILVCGIYVDLNQIRAGEADTPELSTHTSAFDRIRGQQQRRAASSANSDVAAVETRSPDGWLCELTLLEGRDVDVRGGLQSQTGRRASDRGLLSMTLDEYLQLLDASGRIVRSDKAGSIPQHLAPILERLRIKVDIWSDLVRHDDEWFGHIVGTSQQLIDRAARTGRRWLQGQPRCSAVFG